MFASLFNAIAAWMTRDRKPERCPITEWAEAQPEPLPLDCEPMSYAEFLRRQKARENGRV